MRFRQQTGSFFAERRQKQALFKVAGGRAKTARPIAIRERGRSSTVVRRRRYRQYYWRPEQNAILMFDRAGNPSVFLAWPENDWISCRRSWPMRGAGGSVEAMAVRQSMPGFWLHLAFHS